MTKFFETKYIFSHFRALPQRTEISYKSHVVFNQGLNRCLCYQATESVAFTVCSTVQMQLAVYIFFLHFSKDQRPATLWTSSLYLNRQEQGSSSWCSGNVSKFYENSQNGKQNECSF